MKAALVILALLICTAMSHAGEDHTFTASSAEAALIFLVKSGAVCEKFGHNWIKNVYVQMDRSDYRILDSRKCPVCEKVQIKSLDWQDIK